MKKIFATLLIFCSVTLCKAQQLSPPPVEWSKCYGGSSYEQANSINPTPDGGYVIAGYTKSNNGDFPDGYGGQDALIMKIDSVGNLEWGKKYGGYSDLEEATEVFPTSDGGYIFGGYTESYEFEAITNHGYSDYWVVKLNDTGAVQWARCYGGSDLEDLNNIVPLSNGDYYLVGWSTSLDGDISSPSGSQFCWVVKIDSMGNIIWEKSYGSDFSTENFSGHLAIGNNDELICINYVEECGTWSCGYMDSVHYSNWSLAGRGPWLTKIDSSGNIILSSLLNTNNPNGGYASATHFMVPLRNGDIFMGIADYGFCANGEAKWYAMTNANGYIIDSFFHYCLPNFLESTLFGMESSDSLIIFPHYYYNKIDKIDFSGNLIWRITFLPTSRYNGMYLNSDGSMMAVGSIHNSPCNYGGRDIWIVKFKNDIGCLASVSNITATICSGELYNFHGTYFDSAGSYTDTLNSINACDSIIHLTLNVLNASSQILNEVICSGDNYDFNGTLFNSSGIYSDTLTSNNGCDSIITLQLTVLNPNSSFTQSICEGETYDFNGMLLNANGIYNDTLNSSGACDSIVVLSLIVNSVNLNIHLSNDTLTAFTTGTVQWYDCNLKQVLFGASGNIFVPTVTGNYAAIITEGNCTDTSTCINVIVNSINLISNCDFQFSLSPNPTNETVTVQFSQQANCILEITNTLGQIVYTKAINHKSETINLQSLPSGLYFCSVKTEDGKTAQQKLIVQH